MKNLLRLFMREPLLVKRPSPIHGTGIFTTRDIEPLEAFYEIPLRKTFQEPHARCAHLRSGIWVYDETVLNYVNHSCEPNAGIWDIGICYRDRPHLRAKRFIRAGEEITVDYNLTEAGGNKVPCNCRSERCRGYFLRRE
jgi:hypothetical protein